MPIYYPAVAAKMVIRFDEALLTGKTPDPTLPQDNAKTVSSINSSAHAAALAAVNPSDLGQSGGEASDKPALLKGSGNRLSHTLIIVPKTASIELPSYRQAPKFSMTFNFRDFPVDPRAIRALSAEIYIGVVPADNFARGMLGQHDGGRLASQLAINLDNLMLVGVADNLTTSHTEKGSEVMVDGRGLQGMLLDAKIHADQLKELNLDQSIKAVVEQILGKDAQSKAIPVRIVEAEWPNGVPKPSAPELVSRELKGQDGSKSKNPMKGDPNQVAVWDVITRLCDVCGAIPYFIANNLWIRPVKSIFDQKNAGYAGHGDTPFNGPNGKGRPRTIKLADRQLDVSYRKMVYGRNLLHFKLERKFGGAKVPVVQCVSIDNSKPAKERLIIGEWPPKEEKSARSSAVDPSGEQARSEPLRIPVPGIIDKPRLISIARNIYNEVGRGELGGSGNTKDLASLGGDNADADIIRLRPGDAIEFAVDASGVQSFPPVVSELTRQASASPAELSKSIQKRLGMDKDLADVLVGTSRGKFAALQDVFRVANVKYAWDLEAGIAVDFDFQNYITARYDFDKSGTTSEIDDVAAVNNESSYGSASGSA